MCRQCTEVFGQYKASELCEKALKNFLEDMKTFETKSDVCETIELFATGDKISNRLTII